MPLVSISNVQRLPMPPGANGLATISHGIPPHVCPFAPVGGDYLAFLALARGSWEERQSRDHPRRPPCVRSRRRHDGGASRNAVSKAHFATTRKEPSKPCAFNRRQSSTPLPLAPLRVEKGKMGVEQGQRGRPHSCVRGVRRGNWCSSAHRRLSAASSHWTSALCRALLGVSAGTRPPLHPVRPSGLGGVALVTAHAALA